MSNTMSGSNAGNLALIKKAKEQENIDAIGTVYGGDIPNTSLTSGGTTNLSSIEIPAGTYIITAGSEISISSNNIFTISISGAKARARFNGVSGGGASLAEIITVDEPTTLIFRMHSPVAGVKCNYAYFKAIKIA